MSAPSAEPGAALRLSAEQLRALGKQLPLAAARFPSMAERTLELLATEEAWRRGAPDAVSGAFHRLALLQGALLKEEFDAALHGGGEGWTLGAVLVDPRRFILFNQAHGFPAGDQALRAIAQALRQAFVGGRVVRIHGDAFAVLLGPMAEARLGPDSAAQARAALAAAVAPWTPALEFTVATLALTLVSPSHHEVIGPLVWAECERALLTAARVPGRLAQTRRVVLDALVEDPR